MHLLLHCYSGVAHTCGVLPEVGREVPVKTFTGLRLLVWIGRQAASSTASSAILFLFRRAAAPFLRCIMA